MPDWLEELDHTADAGIVVRAPDLVRLFERAAWGLFSVITDPERIRPRESFHVDLEAADREALLVGWLSDLNFRHVTEEKVFGKFEIAELTAERLVATVRGEPIDARRHPLHTEIKAVTYHGLAIEPEDGGWRAQIIFDL